MLRPTMAENSAHSGYLEDFFYYKNFGLWEVFMSGHVKNVNTKQE
jgi:hypothetical protein